jgi:hypothetical protein
MGIVFRAEKRRNVEIEAPGVIHDPGFIALFLLSIFVTAFPPDGSIQPEAFRLDWSDLFEFVRDTPHLIPTPAFGHLQDHSERPLLFATRLPAARAASFECTSHPVSLVPTSTTRSGSPRPLSSGGVGVLLVGILLFCAEVASAYRERYHLAEGLKLTST